jgi:hypothetical protein
MYVSGKMRPIDVLLGMWEGGIKENDGKGKFKYKIFDIFGFYQCWYLLDLFLIFCCCAGWGYFVSFTKVLTIYQIYEGSEFKYDIFNILFNIW